MLASFPSIIEVFDPPAAAASTCRHSVHLEGSPAIFPASALATWCVGTTTVARVSPATRARSPSRTAASSPPGPISYQAFARIAYPPALFNETRVLGATAAGIEAARCTIVPLTFRFLKVETPLVLRGSVVIAVLPLQMLKGHCAGSCPRVTRPSPTLQRSYSARAGVAPTFTLC